MVMPKEFGAAVRRDAEVVRRSLDIYGPPDDKRNSFLVVLSGLPGTGKSYFAAELARRVPFVIVGSDRSRKALVPRPKYTRDEHARVFAACHRVIEALLTEGYRVVFDATNLTEAFRQTLYQIAERTGSVLTVLWFTAPKAVVRRRLDDRASGPNSDTYSDADWRIYSLLRPGEEPVQHPHLRVDSSQDIGPILEEVVQQVTQAR